MPSPTSLSYYWNFGSLLFLCLGVQIFTGILLTIFYTRDINTAFARVSYLNREVNNGWLLRIIHANCARFFFFFIYCHIGRGLYYGRYAFRETWNIGVLILLITIATAFLGYVLPWGQISFWGASVITNLFSAFPYVGLDFVIWLWGGLSVDGATLTRFFALHFLFPFIIFAFAVVHLVFLHTTGSNNPLGLNSNLDKVSLYPAFLTKDIYGIIAFFILFFLLVFYNPWILGDPENFISANAIVTPVHIQPEWYFLFAYAILRSIPNKLGGVLALMASVFMLFAVPIIMPIQPRRRQFTGFIKILMWSLVGTIICLTWLGARPVEQPYVTISQHLTMIYFGLFFILGLSKKVQEKVNTPIISA